MSTIETNTPDFKSLVDELAISDTEKEALLEQLEAKHEEGIQAARESVRSARGPVPVATAVSRALAWVNAANQNKVRGQNKTGVDLLNCTGIFDGHTDLPVQYKKDGTVAYPAITGDVLNSVASAIREGALNLVDRLLTTNGLKPLTEAQRLAFVFPPEYQQFNLMAYNRPENRAAGTFFDEEVKAARLAANGNGDATEADEADEDDDEDPSTEA